MRAACSQTSLLSAAMRVSVGEVRLFVDFSGLGLVPDGPRMRERPTLVMLHGGPGLDHSPFKQPHFSPLGEVAQVLFYDHRGNGRSDLGTADQWTLDTWADDVVRLCDALGIEKPIVFGASFGGFVALNYAVRHPDHPARLILSSTAAHIDLDRAFVMFERLGGVEARDAGGVDGDDWVECAGNDLDVACDAGEHLTHHHVHRPELTQSQSGIIPEHWPRRACFPRAFARATP